MKEYYKIRENHVQIYNAIGKEKEYKMENKKENTLIKKH